jgi:hypothetical protein
MSLVKATNQIVSISNADMPIPDLGPDDTISTIVRDYARGFLSSVLDCSAYVSDEPYGPQIRVSSEHYDDTGFHLSLEDILVLAVDELGADMLREIVERAVLAKDMFR